MNPLVEKYKSMSNDKKAFEYYSSSADSNHGIIYKFHATTLRTLLAIKTDCDKFNRSIGVHRSNWPVSERTGQESDKQYVVPLKNAGLIIPNNDESVFEYTAEGKFVKELDANKERENWILLYLLLANKLDIISTSREIFLSLEQHKFDIKSLLPNFYSVISSKDVPSNRFYEFLTYETFYKIYDKYDFLNTFVDASLAERKEYFDYLNNDSSGVLKKKIDIITKSTIEDDAKLLYMFYYVIFSDDNLTIDNLLKWYLKIVDDVDDVDFAYIYKNFDNVKKMLDLNHFNQEREYWQKNNYLKTRTNLNIDLENEYKNWLLNPENGHAISEGAATAYISTMKKIYKEFKKYKNYESIFNIDKVADAQSYFEYITSNENFNKEYIDKRNTAPRSGLKLYIKFLEEYNMGDKKLFDKYEKGEGENLIIYGTPGCGKSFMLNRLLRETVDVEINKIKRKGLGLSEDRIIRTTFHHDYSNNDFVGQVIPDVKADGSAEYKINPGPFTKALKLALETKGKVALVIEELNRGDAAGIFGDIFQLLDRHKSGDMKGVSQYPIENNLIQAYINKETNYKFNSVRIPSNLYIFATMNTSDQNVFTLDTAFKRRWDFVKLKNDTNKLNEEDKNLCVPGSTTQWVDFVDKINEKMLELDGNLNEDKQLGVYFVDFSLLSQREDEKDKKDDDGDKKRKFAYKLLEYLWNDVVRYDKDKLFKNTNAINTLDKLIDAFCDDNEDSLNIFNVDFKK